MIYLKKMAEKLIYIADNQDLTREGIISFLTRYFNGEAIIEVILYREELFTKVKERSPFLIVIDHSNFEWNSPDDYAILKKSATDSSILVISEVLSHSQARDVINAGISHFIMKSSTEEDFFTAFKAIVNKKKFICSEIYDLLIKREASSAKTPVIVKLSPAEIEIAKLIAEGKTTKEIANHKHLSFHTVNTHRKNIFRKLGINSSYELVRYVYNSGLASDIEYYI